MMIEIYNKKKKEDRLKQLRMYFKMSVQNRNWYFAHLKLMGVGHPDFINYIDVIGFECKMIKERLNEIINLK